MDPLKRIRNVAVTLLSVSPFFILASLIWVSLLADLGSTDTFATHYKVLLATYPVLSTVSGSLVYSFSVLVISIFVCVLFAAYEILRKSIRAQWIKTIVTSIIILVGIGYPALILLHTPPDGYYILIFLALLAYMYTQLRKYSELNFDLGFLRWIFLPTSIAIIAMVVIVAAALIWLLTFWHDSSSFGQPWLSGTTLLFMIVTSIVMAVTTTLTVLKLARSLPTLRGNLQSKGQFRK